MHVTFVFSVLWGVVFLGVTYFDAANDEDVGGFLALTWWRRHESKKSCQSFPLASRLRANLLGDLAVDPQRPHIVRKVLGPYSAHFFLFFF